MASTTSSHGPVLDYVNALRARLGSGPLDELPKGTPCSGERCPIANALPGHVEVDPLYVLVWDEDDCELVIDSTNPDEIYDWVLDFDALAFPELVAE